MPKRHRRHNPQTPRVGGRSAGGSRAPQSVKSLLSRISQSALGRVCEQRQAQADWRLWLKNRLPEDLDAHVTGAVERETTLTIFADSPAWSSRLRFAVVEFETEVREQNAAIHEVIVKVMPRR